MHGKEKLIKSIKNIDNYNKYDKIQIEKVLGIILCKKQRKDNLFMNKIIVAIGGGENGRVLSNGKKTIYDTKIIDEEIVALTNKKNPNFLFIAHAMSFSLDIEENYYKTMEKIYKGILNCNCKILKSTDLENKEKVINLISWADIIYESGGDTKLMISLWRKTGFDKILYDAWNSGKVICGISAGAVCYFNSCNSDYYDENNKLSFQSLSCLNWINIYMTPHYDKVGRKSSSKKHLKENGLVGIMLSNCSALVVVNDNYKIINADCKHRKIGKGYAYKCFYKNDKYYKIKIDNNNYLPLSNLLSYDIIN